MNDDYERLVSDQMRIVTLRVVTTFPAIRGFLTAQAAPRYHVHYGKNAELSRLSLSSIRNPQSGEGLDGGGVNPFLLMITTTRTALLVDLKQDC